MRNIFLAVSLSVLPLSFSTLAEEREDFKCYVETTQGEKIVRFSWDPSKTKLYMAKFVGKRLSKSGQGSPLPLYIKSMIECVKAEYTFEKSQARALEKVTLS
ncbi:TapY2 family type IVa secretion system protein [Shewanella sp. D64]|uniref:TapY2 family type IVa secretion system protein n=1 Tax=unclassified Shewanella TaxID=196818 RepID=UPI0022BA14AD|nr:MULTISPECIES: TapY2 family type IVa secretion system protein [unclassified Shewanella]MEC4728273.1 TapY2 family type IVa secretion system protein [Shewanella sp. D64]MEC4739273.1 TapY2 family type IVa secretion system protein [Shewanella sp. E94]WBJ97066.1 TapY2 family type IVa secretion system protein [Shewanella sp. MTB7]